MKGGPKSSLRPFLHRALQLSKAKGSPCLNKGITLEYFHSSGKMPQVMDLLKIVQRESAIWSGHPL